ncbi:hypothetical protein DFH09DRAFT_1084377 [Mycena vulgaris]|nr:hypothetical protein DFH09DRAFT_1084377 [Mycena vulgaris]
MPPAMQSCSSRLLLAAPRKASTSARAPHLRTDGSSIEFPGFDLDPDLDFSQFGMAPGATPAVFPVPPFISLPPPGKKRRYAVSVKAMPMSMGSDMGTSLKTHRAPLVPVHLVRRGAHAEPELDKGRDGAWPMKVLKKIVPGLFPRPMKAATLNQNPLDAPPAPPAAPLPTSLGRGRALSIRSFKSGKKANARARAVDAENCPPVPRFRMHSFSSFVADDEDETDAEMTAITREAVCTTLRLNEEFEFALVDSDQFGIAL